MRQRHGSSPRYFEICFQCGDTVFTLARSLRIDPRHFAHLSLPAVSTNRGASSKEQREESLRRVREYAAVLVDV